MTHNAETVAEGSKQEGPRWPVNSGLLVSDHITFLGRAGPIDIWLDPDDDAVPFLVVRSLRDGIRDGNWSGNAERIIQRAHDQRVHLTLHDECIIHQLCAPHNSTDQTPT